MYTFITFNTFRTFNLYIFKTFCWIILCNKKQIYRKFNLSDTHIEDLYFTAIYTFIGYVIILIMVT